MPEEIKAWKCKFCSRYDNLRGEIAEHESNCVMNPANQACETCEHYIKMDNSLRADKCSEGIYLNDGEHIKTRIFCSKHKLKITHKEQ